MQSAGYRGQDAGDRMQGTGYRIQDARCRRQGEKSIGQRAKAKILIQDANYRIQDSRFKMQETGNRVPEKSGGEMAKGKKQRKRTLRFV